MTITATDVKNLRDQSGAPMMDCKKALTECEGNVEKATDWLRKKGVETAGKRAGKEANEGRVSSYIHHNGRVGVLLEVNCETDFVANTDDFAAFCRDVSLHIASMKPRYVRRDEVPAADVNKEKDFLSEQVDPNKPPEIREKILEGRLGKFFAEVCLLEQAFVKDDKLTVEQYQNEMVGKIREKVEIKRFVRFELGEEV